MDTPLEESNLAHIGSDADKAARKAAAEMEIDWAGAGSSPGVWIWRVENGRTDEGAPDFGINPWPEDQYGEFYRGDSYIVLRTAEDEDGGEEPRHDVYFWIGAASTQDEYAVAAYKAVELDDYLGGAAVQHREVEGHESVGFMSCLPNKSITYLDGGVASGFRHVEPEDYVPRLYRIVKKGKEVRAFQVPCTVGSLNHGDTFVLDAGTVIYTWFGNACSPFEKAKAAEVAHNMEAARGGRSEAKEDAVDDEFWAALGGGEDDVKEESDYTVEEDIAVEETKMWKLTDEEDWAVRAVEVTPASRDALESDDAFVIDNGPNVVVWVGSGASAAEAQQAMIAAQNHIASMGKPLHTNVVRCLEGQEERCPALQECF